MRVIMAAEEVDVDIEGEETEVSKGEQEDAATGFLQDHHLNSAWRMSDKAVPWNLDSTISEENRTVIEKMLLEEQYYLTRKRLPEKLWTGIKETEKPVIKKPANKSSLFPMKWTKEEKDLFEQGLTKFGRRWTKIAKLIGSRTVLQVKSYARQYFKNKMKQDIAYIEEKNLCNSQIMSVSSEVDQKLKPICTSSFQLRGRADPNLNAVKIEKLSDDEDVNITDETDDPLDSTDQEEMEHKDLLDAGSHSCEAGVHSICASIFDAQACNILNTAEQLFPVTGTSKEQATGFSESTADYPEYENNGNKGPTAISFSCKENLVPWNRHHGKRSEDSVKEMLDGGEEAKDQTDITVFNGINEEHQDEEEELKPPEQEIDMDRNIISEEEKQAIPEFFEGRPSKTPERYLKIRNFILDQWEKCKPKYLNKTSVRPGLKNCGDVNCIGRVHTYLELIGAINFNCEQAVYNRPRPADKIRTKEGNDSMEAYQLAHRLQSMRTRRRRVRDPWGKWCDSKDLEGQTFEHLSAEELARRRAEEEQYRPAKPSRAPRQIKSTFDPFQLIPCLPFTDEKQEPFTVKVSTEALLILEMHSHVSLAEVIGLLGGRYIETEKILEIHTAEPCNSLSTGMQCEMDPVSQTQASETLARRGFSLVGWYHSHPAFDPNPSVRDIDTQAKYQTYFSRGGAQFVGMIISPYNQRNPSLYSQITCLLISEELSTDGSFRLPYKFKILQTPDEPQWTLVLKKAQWIVENYRQSQGRVPMESIFHRESGLTCLQKMMECMRRTLENLTINMLAEEFLTQIEHVFHTNYQAMEESGNLEDPPSPTSEECLPEQIRRENET